MLSKIRKRNLEKNVWKFYLYRLFCSLVFISPIFVLFYQENGLSMIQIMILQSVYTGVIMLTVVPFGILADYIGRKKVLVTNAVFYALGWAVFALGYDFTDFLIAETICALSAGMWMASGTAFFYDTLRELRKENSFKKLFGRVVSINYFGWGISSLIAGFIAVHSLRFPFWLAVFTNTIGLIITFSFTDTKKYKHGDTRYFQHLKEAVKFSAAHPRVRLFMVFSTVTIAVGFMGFILYQPYLTSVSIPLKFFGVIYFLMYVLAALGSKSSYKIEERLGERKTLIVLILIMILSYIGLSRLILVIGVVFPIILMVNGGLFEPVISDYLNKHISSHHRATVLSLHQLMIEGFSAALAPFMGWIVDIYSLKVAFQIAAIILLIDLFILVIVFTIIKRNEIN